MRILIIEGIATSGKSSLINELSKLLIGKNIRVFGEPATHIPIMDRTDELHIEFFKSLILDAIETNAEFVIFDRLHFTQAYRAKASIAEYFEIEKLLATHDTLVAYLQVDEDAISGRVRLATEHRDKEWGDYVQTKGKSFDDIANYYIEQQQHQLTELSNSKIKTKVFNTTTHQYDKIADQILKDVSLRFKD